MIRARFVTALRVFALTLGLVCAAVSARGEDVATADAPVGDRAIWIPRVTHAPSIDNVDMTASGGTVVAAFFQNQPGDGTPASLPTAASISYDANNLYVLFDCSAARAELRRSIARRDNIEDDDQVIVYLDTFHDRRRAYVFAANSFGVQRDGILTEGQNTDYSFDTTWRAQAKIVDGGYRVLFTIPFASLRFSGVPGRTWGIGVGRYIPRTSEYSYWPHITTHVSGFVSQFAALSGLERIAPRDTFQFVPYGAFTALDEHDSSAATRSEERAGFDAKVAHNALTVDLTVNPDFGQIESDDPQVTLNKRYEVVFPEKRPFFVENATFLSTPETLFFSRRVADPQFGGRLTGKIEDWAIGAVVADDRASAGALDSGSGSERAHDAAIRVQRETGRDSSVGAMVTDHELASSYNRVGAVDVRLKLNSNWTLTAQAIRSADRTADAVDRDGSELRADVSRIGRHFTYRAAYLDRSRDFNAALGYINRTDIRQTTQDASYLWRPGAGPIAAIGPSVSAARVIDQAGRLQDWSVIPQFSVYFRRQSQLSLYHSQSYEWFGGVALRENATTVSAYTARTAHITLNGSVGWGTSPNYTPASGLTPFLGEALNTSFGITLRPAPPWRIDETHYYSRLQTAGGDLRLADPQMVFENSISRTKTSFQLTRAASLRAILDYNAVTSNPSLIAQPATRRVTTDFLFAYLVNSFTAMYVGYVDTSYTFSPDPTDGDLTGARLTTTGRQVFVKISYRIKP